MGQAGACTFTAPILSTKSDVCNYKVDTVYIRCHYHGATLWSVGFSNFVFCFRTLFYLLDFLWQKKYFMSAALHSWNQWYALPMLLLFVCVVNTGYMWCNEPVNSTCLHIQEWDWPYMILAKMCRKKPLAIIAFARLFLNSKDPQPPMQRSIFSHDLHWSQRWQNLDHNWIKLANWLRSYIPDIGFLIFFIECRPHIHRPIHHTQIAGTFVEQISYFSCERKMLPTKIHHLLIIVIHIITWQIHSQLAAHPWIYRIKAHTIKINNINLEFETLSSPM